MRLWRSHWAWSNANDLPDGSKKPSKVSGTLVSFGYSAAPVAMPLETCSPLIEFLPTGFGFVQSGVGLAQFATEFVQSGVEFVRSKLPGATAKFPVRVELKFGCPVIGVPSDVWDEREAAACEFAVPQQNGVQSRKPGPLAMFRVLF